jgi:hypothetical protein
MRPGTVHAVITVESSICRGGHCYTTSTLKDTVYALFHTFVCSKYVTNTTHTEAADRLLTRLIHYYNYTLTTPETSKIRTLCGILCFDLISSISLARNKDHMPKLETLDGVLDLLCLAHYFELSNVLAEWKYVPSSHHVRDRKRAVSNRQEARRLVYWFFQNYEVRTAAGVVVSSEEAMKTLHHDFLARQARALVLYKRKAAAAGVEGELPACTPQRVEAAVRETFAAHAAERQWEEVRHLNIETFAWQGERYTFHRSSTPVSGKFHSYLFHFVMSN